RADIALTVAQNVDERLAVDAESNRTPQFRIVERRLVTVDDQQARDVPGVDLAFDLRCLALDLTHQGNRHDPRPGPVELARGQGQDRGRGIADYRVFDAVEIRQAGFPVIRIARNLDRLVGLELDELERPGAD